MEGFSAKKLDNESLEEMRELGRLARGDILTMTTLAGSGHPGGSMSSIDIYLTLYRFANVFPDNPYHPDRDRIVISHGHTSPGVYAALGRLGFFKIDKAIGGFRLAGTAFEGHVERGVPGVEWSTGNLGQGLSAGCGFALGSRLRKKNFQVFVVMGCGEQQKGQIPEARRFAQKYRLNNITVVIDFNDRQISGVTGEIMPQNIRGNYESDGWRVLEVDGHDYQKLYQTFRDAIYREDTPTAILARTVMGKGVSFMEGREEFHGKALTLEQCRDALAELDREDKLDYYRELRKKGDFLSPRDMQTNKKISIEVGTPRSYPADEQTANRNAFGNALEDLAELNYNKPDSDPFAVFDCDLSTSVKTDGFATSFPDNFFQGGIQEHNTATIAGAVSTMGIVTFFADFGVFGVAETYNQHRLNDINDTNLKLICTHLGIGVGEDGKTHQCIDYIGVINNLYGYRIIIPADPNQTDRVIRFIAREPGNFLVGMGRSKDPVILSEEGTPLFGNNYRFIYGKADMVRQGDAAAIISYGNMLHRAISAWEKLRDKGWAVKVLNVSCPSEIDRESIREVAQTGLIVTYEDHNIKTGLGNIVGNVLAEESLKVKFRKLGVTGYAGSGKPDDLYRIQGLDVDSLVKTVLKEIGK
ncbi:MAG: transketolase [Deltaproteobacteria bacterium]|nr:MAG: transketolase [Deltaproteobacteria bacterium]